MAYEIWETTSGNMAGSFATAERALAVVDAFVRREGLEEAATFALIKIGSRGKRTTVASGAALARMATTALEDFDETHRYTAINTSEISGGIHARRSEIDRTQTGR